METFGIIGMSFGTMGFIFGMSALSKVTALEKRLTDLGTFEKELESEE